MTAFVGPPGPIPAWTYRKWHLLAIGALLLAFQARVYTQEAILFAEALRNGASPAPQALLFSALMKIIAAARGAFPPEAFLHGLGLVSALLAIPALWILDDLLYDLSGNHPLAAALTALAGCSAAFLRAGSAPAPGILLLIGIPALLPLLLPPAGGGKRSLILAAAAGTLLILVHLLGAIVAAAAAVLLSSAGRGAAIRARAAYFGLLLLFTSASALLLSITFGWTWPSFAIHFPSAEPYTAGLAFFEKPLHGIGALFIDPRWFERYIVTGAPPRGAELAAAAGASALALIGIIAIAAHLLRARSIFRENRLAKFFLAWMGLAAAAALALAPADPFLWLFALYPLIFLTAIAVRSEGGLKLPIICLAVAAATGGANVAYRLIPDSNGRNNELFAFCGILHEMHLSSKDLLLCDWVEVGPALRYLYGEQVPMRSLRGLTAKADRGEEETVRAVDSLIQEHALRGVLYAAESETAQNLYPFAHQAWSREKRLALIEPYALRFSETRSFTRFGRIERLYYMRRDLPSAFYP